MYLYFVLLCLLYDIYLLGNKCQMGLPFYLYCVVLVYRRKRGTERLSNLPEVTQHTSGRTF